MKEVGSKEYLLANQYNLVEAATCAVLAAGGAQLGQPFELLIRFEDVVEERGYAAALRSLCTAKVNSQD